MMHVIVRCCQHLRQHLIYRFAITLNRLNTLSRSMHQIRKHQYNLINPLHHTHCTIVPSHICIQQEKPNPLALQLKNSSLPYLALQFIQSSQIHQRQRWMRNLCNTQLKKLFLPWLPIHQQTMSARISIKTMFFKKNMKFCTKIHELQEFRDQPLSLMKKNISKMTKLEEYIMD